MIRPGQWNIVIAYSFASDAKSQAAKAYEERVRIAVNAIGRTRVGRELMKTFSGAQDPDSSVWIMPYNGPAGECNSHTGPFLSNRVPPAKVQTYEGTKIQFSPDRFSTDSCGWYPGLRPEETLFHEMVHASRDMNNSHFDRTPLVLMDDYEEFLAVLVTNMYRSEVGAKKFHRDYILKLLVEQKEAEDFLSSKAEYIEALRDLLDDRLVKAIVNLPMAYNPFRDFSRLESAYDADRELHDLLDPSVAEKEAQRIQQIGRKLSEQGDMSMSSSGKAINRK